MTPREPRIGGENRIIIRLPMLAANHGRKSHGRKSRGNERQSIFEPTGRANAPDDRLRRYRFRVKKTHQNRSLESSSDSIRTGLQTQKNAASRRKRRLIDHDT